MNSKYLRLGIVSATAILYSSFASAYDFVVNNIYYNILSRSEFICEVTSNPNIYEGNVEIPEFVDHEGWTYKVVAIGDNAFNESSYKRSYLEQISLPQSIIKIGISAFFCCAGLESLELPTELETIENNAFADCLNIESIDIPKSVTKIGSWAFHNCYRLKSFKISNGEQPIEIPMRALRNAGYNLTLYIGRSIINDDESQLMVSPMILKIADGINVGNLWNSSEISNNLKELEIGKKIIDFPLDLSTYVKLNMLYIHDITPPKCPIFSDNQYKDITVVVPKGSLDTYKSTDGWDEFFNIIEEDIDVVNIIKNGESEYQSFDLTGQPVKNDYKGIVLKKKSNGKALKVLNK